MDSRKRTLSSNAMGHSKNSKKVRIDEEGRSAAPSRPVRAVRQAADLHKETVRKAKAAQKEKNAIEREIRRERERERARIDAERKGPRTKVTKASSKHSGAKRPFSNWVAEYKKEWKKECEAHEEAKQKLRDVRKARRVQPAESDEEGYGLDQFF